jgi:hypothetical protein
MTEDTVDGDRARKKGFRYYLVYSSFAVMVLGLAVVTFWPSSQKQTPMLPRDADHADLKNYQRCPSCHGPSSERPMPVAGDKTHVALDGRLRVDFQKCYLCHRSEVAEAQG